MRALTLVLVVLLTMPMALADGPKKVLLEVGDAADEIDDLAPLQIVEETVDGEVATNGVLVRFPENVVVGDQEIRLFALDRRVPRWNESNRFGPRTERNLFGERWLDDLVVL